MGKALWGVFWIADDTPFDDDDEKHQFMTRERAIEDAKRINRLLMAPGGPVIVCVKFLGLSGGGR